MPSNHGEVILVLIRSDNSRVISAEDGERNRWRYEYHGKGKKQKAEGKYDSRR